jgi:hypothetical protein
MAEFEAAEKELYTLAAWLVNDAARLKAHVADCCMYACDVALAKTLPPGLMQPFPTHTLVGLWLAAGWLMRWRAGGQPRQHTEHPAHAAAGWLAVCAPACPRLPPQSPLTFAYRGTPWARASRRRAPPPPPPPWRLPHWPGPSRPRPPPLPWGQRALLDRCACRGCMYDMRWTQQGCR